MPCPPEQRAQQRRPHLSVIVPAVNEAQTIQPLLNALQSLRVRGCEVILVDGGSSDSTVSIAEPLADKVVPSRRGRARQMNAGADASNGTCLWFLHADSVMPEAPDELIINALANSGWGYFAVRLSGAHPLLRIVELAMNWRVRLTRVVTGDHGLFVSRATFEQVGGFPDIALMEDVAISKRLRKLSSPRRLVQPIVTSSRRWESGGIVKTVLCMWALRLMYFLGVSPTRLERLYRGGK